MNKSVKAMGDYTFASRYARYLKDKKRRSTWNENVDIVKNMHILKYAEQIKKYPELLELINWAFEQVREKRVLGSQRALQYGGKPILKKNARLYNCTSSYCDRIRFFQEGFWLLLAGCGVGMSVQKHHVEKLPEIQKRTGQKETYIIPDSIEGWADSLGVLLSSYFIKDQVFPEYFGKRIVFDFSQIRKKGSPLSSGVGKAPGPEGLKDALEKIEILLERIIGNSNGPINLKPINAYDIMMHASDAVLSGGVRRSACISLFSPDDEEMMEAKIGDWLLTNPQRGRSNNSVLLIRDQTTEKEFMRIMERTKQFGEPGFVWADSKELLVNPCCEIGMYAKTIIKDENGNIKYLENGDPVQGKSGWSFCNLCEINGGMIKTPEDFTIAAKAAAIIGTLQAGYTSFSYLGEATEEIVKAEALLGVSMTGMMDSPDILFDEKLQRKMAKLVLQENEKVASMLGINSAARSTCVKPSGSTSLILGTSSGVHPHHSRRYFRRIQSNKDEAVLQWFKLHNPLAVEESLWSASDTDEIITFPVQVERGSRTKLQISALQLLELVKSTQKNWVLDGMNLERCVASWLKHNVSNTIHVKDNEWDDVGKFIFKNRKYFAGVSLLPIHGDKDYPQAPFCKVYTGEEVLREYGKGSFLASGLIVDGLKCFNGNLWDACSAALGIGKPLYPEHLKKAIKENPKLYENDGLTVMTNQTLMETWLLAKVPQINEKRDWVRRAKQFARRYFDNDLRKMTYCLKDLFNYKLWLDLNREWQDVDYTKLIEYDDNTKIQQTVACSGGQCEIL